MAGKLAVMSSTSLRKDSQTASQVMDHFRGKTVGLLLWGDAFRPAKAHWEGGDVNCVLDSFEAQREATLSQRDKILRPLRRSGARVQVLFTFPYCDQHNLTQPLHDALAGWLGRANVAGSSFVSEAHALEDHLRAAWQL